MNLLTEYFMYTAPDPEGNESVVGIQPGKDAPFMIPLVARTLAEVEQYRQFAEKYAEAMKTKVTLVRFTRREAVETIG